MVRKHLFWAIPLLVLGLTVLAGLLALPAFVAAPAHRATVEGFASQLTGREVHISGQLSLSYLPRPEITATGITITGPDHEVITARALSFDISLATLLRGQFGVQTLHLESPLISFPWPIPGGINDIAPPPWLTTLHAQINNGKIRIGAVSFSDVDADLFTGTGGRVHITGTGNLAQTPISLDLSIGQTASLGGTPLLAHATFAGIKADLDGSLDTNSLLSGQLALQMPDGIKGSMQIQLNAKALSASDITLQKNDTHLSGNAQLTFQPLLLDATLLGQNLDASHIPDLAPLWPRAIPAHISLSISNFAIAGHIFPSLKATLVANADSRALKDLELDAPGAATLKGDLSVTDKGALSGQLTLAAPDLSAFLAGFGLPTDTGWSTAALHATVQGTPQTPQLTDISGTLGTDHVDGLVYLSDHHAAFNLHFDHLALLKLAKALHESLSGSSLSADGTLAATQAEAGPVKLANLFIDSSFDNGWNVRRATANLYGGMVGGSMVLDSQLHVLSAHMFLNLPTGTPLITALLPTLKLPHALTDQRLNLIAAASGAPTTLAASAVLNLGPLTFTSSPVINLAQHSAEGALSLRAPDAIEVFKILGLTNGCSRMAPLPGYPFQSAPPCVARADDPGLAFPGPGSLSLRAHFTAAPNAYSLTDFNLSSGLLNASGRLSLSKNNLTGQIAAGTLALPPLPMATTLPDHLPVSGQINVSAERVVYAGQNSLGSSSFTLTLAPDEVSLTKLKANLAGGALLGTVDLKLPPDAMPVLSANLTATNVDASALNLPQPFPFSLATGQINATSTLTASGYTIRTWAATLKGNITLNAQNGELAGLSLPNIITALTNAKRADAGLWLNHGTTAFSALTLAATLSQGNCTLTQATLTGPTGTLSVFGGIDLFDKSLALRVEANPTLQPPLTLTTRLIGPWAHPSRTSDIRAALKWHPAPAAH